MEYKEFMGKAIETAYDGIKLGHGGPFGVVIESEGQILAVSHNTVLKEKDPTKHAEINAISIAAKKCGTYDLSNCTLYSTTEPCPMCFSAIHWAKIGSLVYGTQIKDVVELGFNELMIPASKMKEEGRSPVKIEGGFMLTECMALLNFWETLPNKRVY